MNLIPFNPMGPEFDLGYQKPSEERILAFQEVLQKAQFTTIIRQSRGADIGAACGQLVAKGEWRIEAEELKRADGSWTESSCEDDLAT